MRRKGIKEAWLHNYAVPSEQKSDWKTRNMFVRHLSGVLGLGLEMHFRGVSTVECPIPAHQYGIVSYICRGFRPRASPARQLWI